MKVVQFIASTGWGGAERVFVDLCNEIARHERLTAVTYPNPAIVDRLGSGVEVRIIPSVSRYNPLHYWSLYRIIKEGGFDVIHTHCAKATEIIHRICYFHGMRHVATKHNARKAKVFNKVRNVTAVSVAAAKSVRQGATVIYNGINPVAVSPIDTGFPADTHFRILAVGRLDPIKGFDRLIEQAAAIRGDFLLDIAGEGPEFDNLRRQIDAHGLDGKIRLLGFQADIPGLMAKSDLVIISSHSEGFPLVLVESLYYAKVLISTPVGGVSEILDSRFIADPSDLLGKAMQVAADYAEYRQHFEVLSSTYRDRFSIQGIAASYRELYRSVMDREP